MIELTDEQQRAIEAVGAWYDGRLSIHSAPEPFRLFGPAGTGKTTLAKHIAGSLGLHDVVFGAYTGKAAQVLQRKGVDASTIHSAIYKPARNTELRAEHRELEDRIDTLKDMDAAGSAEDLGPSIYRAECRIAEIERELRKPFFELNPASEWAHADLIVLDEVSMVDSQMAADIESFGVPVLVLGDPAQLPPVGGAGHYTSERPDVLLETIHRQALESPVLRLATEIRLSGASGVTSDWVIWKDLIETASVSRAMQADQILCWRNATRWKLTERIRANLGRAPGVVDVGDRIMCLVNNKRDLGVLNGQQFEVLEVKDDWHLRLRDDDGQERWIEVWPDGFQGLAGEADLKNRRAFRGSLMAATYANVITVHKAQGSEWPHVYVVDETTAMMAMTTRREGETAAIRDARRWLYTAVTRASEKVTLGRLRGQ